MPAVNQTMTTEQVQEALTKIRDHIDYGERRRAFDLIGSVCKAIIGMPDSEIERIGPAFIDVVTDREDSDEASAIGYRVYPERYALTSRWKEPEGVYPACIQDVDDTHYLIWIGEVIRSPEGYRFTWYQDIRPRNELKGFGDFPKDSFVRVTVPEMNLYAGCGIHFADFMGAKWKKGEQEISDMKPCPPEESVDIHAFIAEHRRRSPWFYEQEESK